MSLITITQAGFDDSWVRGHQRVLDVASLLSGEVLIDDGPGCHDIVWKPDGKNYRIEVKNEDNQIRTGRIAIEYYQKGKVPSGILTSDAHIWIHTLQDMAVLYVKNEMLEWLHDMDLAYPIQEFKGKSDTDNRGRLVPIRHLVFSDKMWVEYTEFSSIPLSRVWWEIKYE